MNIQILDSWLREHLETNAKPHEIAKSVSLSGPSFERTDKLGNDYVYDIEVTTNRVDMMSVAGIARECAAILPEFGYKAKLVSPKSKKVNAPKKSLPLKLTNNSNLSKRLTAVILTDIKNIKTPFWMVKRLEASGVRSLNAVIDITNYVMLELGHPTHVFDYDLLKDNTIKTREAKKGEKFTSLDNKTYELLGGEVVFVNSKNEIIDLPGIIGSKNSVVSNETKNIVFFLDDIDATKIRKASMTHNIRTLAAVLNEKGVDPALADVAVKRGIELYQDICKATLSSKIYDIYSKPFKAKKSICKRRTYRESFGSKTKQK